LETACPRVFGVIVSRAITGTKVDDGDFEYFARVTGEVVKKFSFGSFGDGGLL